MIQKDLSLDSKSSKSFRVAVQQPVALALRERHPLRNKATLEVAVKAINEGAISRFFVKPCNIIDLAVTIRQALQQKDLMMQARRLLRRVHEQSAILGQIEREDPALLKVKRDAQRAILLEDPPEDFETFMKKIHETLA